MSNFLSTAWSTARQPARLLGLMAGALLVWFASLGSPLPLSDGLDASWSYVLNLARVEHWQFGRDLVFTYGPWGYLTTPYTIPELFWSHCLWEVFFKAALAATIAVCAARLPWWRAALLFVVGAMFLPLFGDASYSFVLAAVLWANAAATEPRRSTSALSGGVLGFFALQKFTFFVFTAAGVSGVACVWLARRRAASAATIVGGWLLGVVSSWLAAAQSWANVVLFVRRSLAQAATYPGSMVLDEPPAIFWWGIATLALGGVTVCCAARRQLGWSLSARALLVVLGAGMGFLVWKQSFIRADGHVLGLFLFAAVAGAALRPRAGAALTLVALAGVWAAAPGFFRVTPDLLKLHLTDSWTHVTSPLATQKRFLADTATAAAAHQLPAIRQRVGQQSVDVFGFEQVVVFWNHLNYRPRPAFQSYQATSAELTQLNADYYQSPHAPEFVLARLDTIDGRFPPLDDARALRALVANYRFEMEEQGWLLLRHRAAVGSTAISAPTETQVTLGATIDLPPGPQAIWVTIDVRPSWSGRLRSLFYKPRIPALRIDDERGTRNFRLVTGAASGGFLISPVLTDTADLRRLLSGEPPPDIHSLAIDVSPADRRFFAPVATVSFSQFALPRETR